MRRFKIIIDDSVQPGPFWQQIIFMGREAMKSGYGSIANFLEGATCSDADKQAISAHFDDSPYIEDDPMKTRIYRVHPETWESAKSQQTNTCDVFTTRKIEVRPSVFFEITEPATSGHE